MFAMRPQLTLGLIVLMALAIVPAGAFADAHEEAMAEWSGEVDGPYMSLEVIETKPYGVPAYLEYLGKGYIPMLEAAKAAGHVMDYGVLTGVTGNAGDGNVMIWWVSPSMDAMEKAGDLMGEKAESMRTPEEWMEMTDAMEKVRKPLSTRIMRMVTWSDGSADEGDGE